MFKQVVLVGVLTCAGLLQARTTEAGLADFIWGLSGPQLIGLGFGCRWEFGTPPKREVCEVGGSAPVKFSANAEETKHFFSIGGMVFRSTGRDSENQTERYSPGDVYMIAFEPSVSVRKRYPGVHNIYHGVGPTINYLFGHRRDYPDVNGDPQKFDGFWKGGVKVTMAEKVLAKQHLAVGVNVRLYPRGFTDDEFRPGGRLTIKRPFEAVWGGYVNIALK